MTDYRKVLAAPQPCPSCRGHWYDAVQLGPEAWGGIKGSGPVDPEASEVECPHCKGTFEPLREFRKEGAPRIGWVLKTKPVR